MFFHTLTFAGSRGSCLKTKPIGRAEDLASVNAMKQTCVIGILAFCLFNWILYVPSTIFQLNTDGSSWVEPVLS